MSVSDSQESVDSLLSDTEPPETVECSSDPSSSHCLPDDLSTNKWR